MDVVTSIGEWKIATQKDFQALDTLRVTAIVANHWRSKNECANRRRSLILINY
jgi:hypothetical protein